MIWASRSSCVSPAFPARIRSDRTSSVVPPALGHHQVLQERVHVVGGGGELVTLGRVHHRVEVAGGAVHPVAEARVVLLGDASIWQKISTGSG
jgi:hypothetical protein